jgi:hypothetical protein
MERIGGLREIADHFDLFPVDQYGVCMMASLRIQVLSKDCPELGPADDEWSY